MLTVLENKLMVSKGESWVGEGITWKFGIVLYTLLLLLLLLSRFSRVRLYATHGLQLTRLLQPWDFLGKNTGVDCHFLLQCMKVKSESELTQSCPTPSDPMNCSLPGSSILWDFPGKSTGVDCHCLLCKIATHFLI